MKKRVVSLILLAASALTVTLCAVLQAQSQRMADKIIRLHVVANSDTSADQAVKLAVRDAVLREAGRVLDGAEDPKQAVAAQLPALEAAANAELQRQGSEDLARVSFRRELFPTREYDTFSLPAGVYDSLRVMIGQGEGHNWWCVVYPSICFTASAEELTEIAVSAGLTEDEAARLTGQSEGYVFRVQIVELAQKLWRWLSGRFSPAGR